MQPTTTYKFSSSSKQKLETCNKRLQMIARRAIDVVDFTVLEGRRSKSRQNELYEQGKSKVRWPESKHNIVKPGQLSKAFDIAPYPIDWADFPDTLTAGKVMTWAKDRARFYHLAGVIKALAHEMGIKIRWGGDWDGDNDFNDQKFNDLVHYELIDL